MDSETFWMCFMLVALYVIKLLTEIGKHNLNLP